MNYVVISGAVIDSPNGLGIRFRQKCDNCGLIQGNFSSSSAEKIKDTLIALSVKILMTY